MPANISSDTSCLILLDNIGELGLLQKLFGEIVTTKVVAAEFAKPFPDWIRVQNPIGLNQRIVLESGVGKGEASAIALALELTNALLIIDDLRGRKLARRLGITITGTLGVLVQAKQNGHVRQLKPILEKLQVEKFRLSEELIIEALRLTGEL